MSDDITRETITVPKQIEMPRLLDFYEMQTEETTQIAEFYDRLNEGDLSTTQCNDCDALHFPPRIICPECTSDDLDYVSLPHEGELFAFGTVHGAPIGLEDEVPFVTGVVDLDGVDVQLASRIDGADYDDLEIGDPVRLKIVDIDGPTDADRVFYRFEPAE